MDVTRIKGEIKDPLLLEGFEPDAGKQVALELVAYTALVGSAMVIAAPVVVLIVWGIYALVGQLVALPSFRFWDYTIWVFAVVMAIFVLWLAYVLVKCQLIARAKGVPFRLMYEALWADEDGLKGVKLKSAEQLVALALDKRAKQT